VIKNYPSGIILPAEIAFSIDMYLHNFSYLLDWSGIQILSAILHPSVISLNTIIFWDSIIDCMCMHQYIHQLFWPPFLKEYRMISNCLLFRPRRFFRRYWLEGFHNLLIHPDLDTRTVPNLLSALTGSGKSVSESCWITSFSCNSGISVSGSIDPLCIPSGKGVTTKFLI